MSEVPPSVPGLVRFGSFELDARSGELRKAGVRLGLQEQPLQVLILLLARPGQLVTREELRQRLWPGDTFVDFDHGLNAVINRLRDTLGDSADTPRFIETLPRRGYRFIAPVDGNRPIDQSGSNEAAAQADVQPTDIPPATASDTSEPRRSRGWFSTGRAARRAGIAALSAIVLDRCGDRRVAAPTSAGGRSLTATSRAAHDAQGVGRASDIFARRHSSRVHLERRQEAMTPGTAAHGTRT